MVGYLSCELLCFDLARETERPCCVTGAEQTPDAKRRPTYRKRHRQLKLMAVYFETVDFEMDCFVAR